MTPDLIQTDLLIKLIYIEMICSKCSEPQIRHKEEPIYLQNHRPILKSNCVTLLQRGGGIKEPLVIHKWSTWAAMW